MRALVGCDEEDIIIQYCIVDIDVSVYNKYVRNILVPVLCEIAFYIRCIFVYSVTVCIYMYVCI